MSLNIKNPEAHRLAAELAAVTGESLTAAVTAALRERLERVRGCGADVRAAEILAIGRDCAARLSPETRALDHATLLYDDELGLPR
jgi:antitoxin VapB